MTPPPDAPWLAPLAARVTEHLGLDFPPGRWPDLLRGTAAAARADGAGEAEAFVQRLLAPAPDAAALQALAEALTVGETYFFRERRSFEALADEILPPLIADRRAGSRRLRFWSAGCCTGEEAYSLAILLDRLMPDLDDWQVTILATDVNRRFLRQAARAEYGEWSFRDAPPWLKGRYFTAGRRGHALLPRIRRMVRFAPLNLAELPFPQPHGEAFAMDVILCRNVLMYFPPALMRRVCRGFRQALADGGWLSLAATELGAHAAASLDAVYFEDAVFYRKTGRAPVAASAGTMATPAPARVAGAVPAAAAPASAAAPLPVADIPPSNDDDGRRLARLARAHADAGRLAPALEAVEQALAGDKMDAGMHHLHAVVLLEMGHLGRARAALRRALYLEPNFVIAHHALGLLALREGEQADAARHFRNVLRLLDGTDPEEVLPHSGGLAAGRLQALVNAAVCGPAAR